MLLIDLGNSLLKWALYDGKQLQVGTPINYQLTNFEDLLQHYWGNLSKPERVLLSSVANCSVKQRLEQWIETKWLQAIEKIVSQPFLAGIANGYDNFRQLGIDRLLALVAARAKQTDFCCVIDCGTAVTMDVLDENGNHWGGLIIPSRHSMQRALAQSTNQIDWQRTKQQKVTLLAKNTEDGVFNGCLFAVASTINQFIMTIEEQFNRKATIFITGGDAMSIKTLLSMHTIYLPNLVLEGILIYAQQQGSN